MNEKECHFHFKIHRFAEWLGSKKSMWLKALGGTVVNFNMAFTYAKVIAHGANYEKKRGKRK